MRKNNNDGFVKVLWKIAIIFEWINVVLFMAAMGYEFNIPIYREIESFSHIAIVYYFTATIDIVIFWILSLISRNQKRDKDMWLAIYCGLVQIALLIYKIKL